MIKRILAFAFIVFGFFSPAQGQNLVEKISVSCTTNGQVIYKNDLPGSATFDQKKKIIDSFPHAMCVFLTKDPSALSSSSLDGSDDSLVTALAAIASGKTGEKYPEGIDRIFSQDNEIAEILGKGPGTPRSLNDIDGSKDDGGYVNLTLGIYRSVEMNDVLAHWRLMQEHGSTLSKLIPTFDIIDDITVLSIMDVPDTIADKVCTEASEKGQGCIAFF